ncbi:malonic semialdehyde reductase [Corallococcus exiguus]|uniref:malonic semialdehyde reductase n=1 Tax=Corallococcus TaxID=83461 RepID=UPI000ECB6700|nr:MULTISPECIES: malonic semialdehyde reductase [Corallococcus]NNB88242.1 malonic semialdehyde reductase [Corallococcus exiguus]NNB92779.1 malonic semialdehyde reductase [Corallococcus exiguus]NNC06822.1 malonic semialdehyde reductase [Corallococcus exiguus]NPC52701.1 malonic semialdehyde reductase [Corallococcus exiguus]RKH81523.1 malonic semialdehyde reductase [Corallococcus sp. AB032C]
MATPNTALDTDSLEQLFTEARTHSGWRDRPVTDETLRRIYELARMAPTAVNSQPVRLVFVRSREAKERLKPALSPGNVDKTMQAPVTVIVAYDTAFHEQMPKLFPARDMKSVFAAMTPEAREQAAFMNGTLQGGYVILAARSLGLDCGPMGGFDKAKVDEAFLQGTGWKSNFLINLGYGDPAKLFPRNPRLSFEDACRMD